ncbi:Transcription initiation factor IIA subunit 1 [Lamellibrachia satsuma]|nr:Transcription initiation factor IIA subunit 1 [Lamellibrachia satsuma]
MGTPNPVPKFYTSVVEDVITNVRESFLDDNVDEQVLQELKHLWETKMLQSKAVDNMTADQDRAISRFKQQQQQAAQLAQRTMTVGSPATVAAHLQQPQAVPVQTQLPVYNQATGTLGLSGAAHAATLALPGGIYSQHLARLQDGQLILQTGGQLQAQGTHQIIQLMPGQALSQAQLQASGQLQAPGQVTLPVSVVGQAEQSVERKPASASQAVIQLDGALDSKSDDDDVKSDDDDVACVTTQAVAQASSVDTCVDTRVRSVRQLDGAHDSSSDDDGDDDDDDDDDDDNDDDNENNENGDDGPEEDPLNSADDISDEDPTELFDSENVVVCQFEKINRSKNKWKFTLKDGIMNLNGKDYVFQKLTGDAEW